MLVPHGTFITRSYIRPAKLHASLEDVLRFRNEKWPRVQIYTSAALYFLPIYTDEKTEFINVEKLLEDLKTAKERKLLREDEYEWLKARFEKDKKVVAIPTLESLEMQMSEHFRIWKTTGNEIYSDLQPIHVLEKPE